MNKQTLFQGDGIKAGQLPVLLLHFLWVQAHTLLAWHSGIVCQRAVRVPRGLQRRGGEKFSEALYMCDTAHLESFPQSSQPRTTWSPTAGATFYQSHSKMFQKGSVPQDIQGKFSSSHFNHVYIILHIVLQSIKADFKFHYWICRP